MLHKKKQGRYPLVAFLRKSREVLKEGEEVGPGFSLKMAFTVLFLRGIDFEVRELNVAQNEA